MLSLMKELGVSTKGVEHRHPQAFERLLTRVHRFTGHAQADTLHKLAKYHDVELRASQIQPIIDACPACRHTRRNAKPVKQQIKRSDQIIAYTDITQPSTKEGINGAKYIATFIDDGDEMVFTGI